MPLYIRDDEVAQLAEELKVVTGASNKTEAVRTALKDALERNEKLLSFQERIRAIQDRVAAIGERDPDFDMKKFSDEMWGDDD